MLRVVVTVFLCIPLCIVADPLEVTTNKGIVRGITLKSKSGKEVDAWYGIPYADKPIGDLRFKPPLPAKSWDGVLETSSLPNACNQLVFPASESAPGAAIWIANTPVSEDCLYINVVAPKPRPQNASVLVWIYGGGFTFGTSTLDLYDFKTVTSEENIITVSMQYRVGSIGFLYLGNSEVPGNAGFLDQVAALQWIQDNIAAFGGDPEKVTIFGESSAAACVAYHLFNPVSKHLFKRAILQSGSLFAEWAGIKTQTAIERGLQLAEQLGCPHDTGNMSETIKCLKKANATEIAYAEQMIAKPSLTEIVFAPVQDGEVFVDPFLQAANQNFKQGNILLGVNSDEGNYFLMQLFPHIFKNEENITFTYENFVEVVKGIGKGRTKLELEAMFYEYTNYADMNNSDTLLDAMDKVLGDLLYTCNTKLLADIYTEAGNDVYFYFFKHKSDKNHWPRWTGCMHADEIAFIFGEPLNLEKGYSPDQIDLSKRMIKYWCNFAKTGNPNKPDVTTCDWPPYTVNERSYIIIDVNHCSVSHGGVRPKQCAFWTKLIPKLKSFQCN